MRTRMFLAAGLAVLIGCTHVTPNRQTASAKKVDWLAELPGDATHYVEPILRQMKSFKGDAKRKKEIATRISKYVAFVLHDGPAHEDGDPSDSDAAKKLISRLLESSTQFILCEDLSDFACLEKKPELTPTDEFRVDTRDDLGTEQVVNASLNDNLESYFTEQIHVPEDEVKLDKTLASVLEKKILTEAKDGLVMAVYGIDDIDGSMKGVYNAVLKKIADGVDVMGVFDNDGVRKEVEKPAIFSYLQPPQKDSARWILAPYNDDGEKTVMDFQYNGGTQGLIKALLKPGAKSENDARGRLEWKNSGIMHNKFMIFRNGKELSLWSGTANVSRTCMGTDRNSNMAVFLRNTEVANSFLEEFKEMYTFIEPTPENENDDIVGLKGNDFPYGRFHTQKKPNTHRYFHFDKDNSDVRVYFSPTDDAEHRAILPMIHSAQAGDKLKISMFGGAGIEFVRAFEEAADRGVDIQIVMDYMTGSITGSWAAKKGQTVLQSRKSKRKGTIEIKKNAHGKGEVWKQNHQKIGLLLRKTGNGYRAEQLIVGSQNWSAAGNDQSDENVLAFRNTGKGVEAGYEFDRYFTELLWDKADEYEQ